ncbi:hypothetical protein H0A36_13880 [Endozoicomonas sp. SM1973]|uniref:DUF423 domain-containing protein n=1 Tax=Spartinivicinus marinus TaxID=2994442 RepID=A0A853ID48_9GAMM|nr:hypothetical protein [Spartinivicinus marinus]NYZ67105.1 hypothetical protein [Spartinivicinus marinus]
MNIWIFSAGVLGLLTSLVHIFAGQIDPVRPFLKSELDDIPKATLLACWHIVTVILVTSSAILTYAGWVNANYLTTVVLGLSLTYVSFAAVFMCVGWYFFKHHTFIKLPQWVLLLPIGALGFIGSGQY